MDRGDGQAAVHRVAGSQNDWSNLASMHAGYLKIKTEKVWSERQEKNHEPWTVFNLRAKKKREFQGVNSQLNQTKKYNS